MSRNSLSAAQCLALEERQLRYFLTAVRPVGEEKSELYPEPQYFHVAFISVAALLPEVLDRIAQRLGGPERYGERCRRVLSSATALHLSGLAFLATWGREMWLALEPAADHRSGVIAPDIAPVLSDARAAHVLDFSHRAVSHYRRDGNAYPNESAALGTDYRILDSTEARELAAGATALDADGAQSVLRLLASIRALSFLMEGETREALMMHGPYPVGPDGEQLVLFECCDLRWELFPDFPLPGVRWRLPPRQFPVANLAIALVLKGSHVQADRFGTLYLEPFGAEQLVAATLLTRGTDAFVDAGLSTLAVSEARSLARACDEIQEHMFLQLAEWDLRQRMAAGVCQEHMLLLRMLSAAGFSREDILAEAPALFERSAPIVARYFDGCLARTVDQLPFYQRLGAFAAGTAPSLFTPFQTIAPGAQ